MKVNKVETNYIIEFSHGEFGLLLRALGHAAGMPVRFKEGEIDQIKTLNLRMNHQRVQILTSLMDVAQGALEKAQAGSDEPAPGEEEAGGGTITPGAE